MHISVNTILRRLSMYQQVSESIQQLILLNKMLYDWFYWSVIDCRYVIRNKEDNIIILIINEIFIILIFYRF